MQKTEVYVANMWGGIVCPGKSVNEEQLQEILNKSIYNGGYGNKKLAYFKFLYSVAVLFVIVCAYAALITAIRGDIAWVLFTAGILVGGIIIQKYIVITSLLKKCDELIVLVPKIKGITHFPPRFMGYKDYIDMDRPLIGFLLPKKIVAIKHGE